jgi:IgA Peptidase M64/Calx-beta domain/Domain of unknown function (DUF4214)
MQYKSFTFLIALFASCLLLPAGTVRANPYETIVNSGNSQNRLDIAIVGDGYTAGEQDKYKADVQNVVQGFFAEQPFLDYKNYFNVQRVDVISAQSGADHPERSSFVDTAFDATYRCSGIQRLVCVNTGKVSDVLTNSLGPAQRDIAVVVVNDAEYGGSGGSVAVVSTSPFAINTLLHEQGHTLGFLADEYGGPAPPACNNATEPSAVNATRATQRDQIKWNAWIDPATPLPTGSTDAALPGLYQGAVYCDAGLYRPTYRSKMRASEYPFDQVNSEQLVRRIYNFVSPLDSRLPANDLTVTKGQTPSFSVTTPLPSSHNLTINWLVDGQQQATGATFNLNSNNLSVGSHTVSAAVNDPTSFVRSDPNHVLSATTSWTINVLAPSPVQLDSANYNKSETDGLVSVVINRTGDTSGALTVDYATADSAGASGCSVQSGVASSRCDYLPTAGTLRFAANEITKTISIPIVDDAYAEGAETFTLTLSNATGGIIGSPGSAVVTIADNESVNGPNPADQASFFVRQHYLDFLNRNPDASGLAFWANQITECEPPGATCSAEVRRINVSAAFFLSIEFQETGYLVERIYKSAYGEANGASVIGGTPHLIKVPIIRLNEFLPDTQQIAKDVVVGVGNWNAQLEANKVAFTQEFVTRSRFVNAYPTALTPAQFVDALFQRAAVAPSDAERASIIGEFSGAATSADTAARARGLRRVAENETLKQLEKNKAFVLMQYFGYMRRNPDDPQDTDHTGYDFWLQKLNEHNGNFISAEMVKAFIVSGEYRNRFGT